jgi:cobalt/nickel transport system ATP-binding protein
MNILEINDLSLFYNHSHPVFNDFNLQIINRQKLGIIGANGAGKTTLFLSICGILQPQKGEIKLFDKLVKVGEFHSEIGLVFQNPDDQLFCPKVRDDVAFGPENMGLTPQEVERRVREALLTTGVTHLAERIPHQLSGGEKCMVAIASVLAMGPKIILYDEPSANLDLRARRRLINFLHSSPETILVASHDLELILAVCDRVILLNQGKIVADGIPATIMSNQALMEANSLEVPPSLQQKHL